MPPSDISNNVFILYMLIGANFLANLFGCEIQQLLTNSMVMKHIVGFMTMLFFVVIVDKTNMPPAKKMANTLMYYFVFLLTTRMDIKWWTPFVLILCATYVLGIFKDAEPDKEKKKMYEETQKKMTLVNAFILLVGVLVYIGRKRAEYKGSFDWVTFLIGKPNCLANADGSQTISDMEAIKNVFG